MLPLVISIIWFPRSPEKEKCGGNESATFGKASHGYINFLGAAFTMHSVKSRQVKRSWGHRRFVFADASTSVANAQIRAGEEAPFDEALQLQPPERLFVQSVVQGAGQDPPHRRRLQGHEGEIQKVRGASLKYHNVNARLFTNTHVIPLFISIIAMQQRP